VNTHIDLGTHSDLGTQADSVCCDVELKPWIDFVEYVREYARERPEVVACLCFSVGLILGWKLKPW
jgi:hypothetical protein